MRDKNPGPGAWFILSGVMMFVMGVALLLMDIPFGGMSLATAGLVALYLA